MEIDMTIIYKYEKRSGFKEQLKVKKFKEKQLAYDFLNKQANNDWNMLEGENIFTAKAPTKSGTYRLLGGQWLNKKQAGDVWNMG